MPFETWVNNSTFVALVRIDHVSDEMTKSHTGFLTAQLVRSTIVRVFKRKPLLGVDGRVTVALDDSFGEAGLLRESNEGSHLLAVGNPVPVRELDPTSEVVVLSLPASYLAVEHKGGTWGVRLFSTTAERRGYEGGVLALASRLRDGKPLQPVEAQPLDTLIERALNPNVPDAQKLGVDEGRSSTATPAPNQAALHDVTRSASAAGAAEGRLFQMKPGPRGRNHLTTWRSES